MKYCTKNAKPMHFGPIFKAHCSFHVNASINIKPEWVGAYVWHLTSITFSTLGNLFKSLRVLAPGYGRMKVGWDVNLPQGG